MVWKDAMSCFSDITIIVIFDFTEPEFRVSVQLRYAVLEEWALGAKVPLFGALGEIWEDVESKDALGIVS
jgi:hypothetical protein